MVEAQSQEYEVTSWDAFKEEMREAFTSKLHKDKLICEWDNLHQRFSSVKEYTHKFLKLMLHVDGFSEDFKVIKYIKGLKSNIGADVKAQRPTTLKDAMILAEIYEEKYSNAWPNRGSFRNDSTPTTYEKSTGDAKPTSFVPKYPTVYGSGGKPNYRFGNTSNAPQKPPNVDGKPPNGTTNH